MSDNKIKVIKQIKIGEAEDAPLFDIQDANITTPQQFGAKGDGIQDDSEFIQNALDQGGIIYFPPGVYKVTKTLYATTPGVIKCDRLYPTGPMTDTGKNPAQQKWGARIELHPSKNNDYVRNRATESFQTPIQQRLVETYPLYDDNTYKKLTIPRDYVYKVGFVIGDGVSVDGLHIRCCTDEFNYVPIRSHKYNSEQVDNTKKWLTHHQDLDPNPGKFWDMRTILLQFDGYLGQRTYPSQVKLEHIKVDCKNKSVQEVIFPEIYFDFLPFNAYNLQINDIHLGGEHFSQLNQYAFHCDLNEITLTRKIDATDNPVKENEIRYKRNESEDKNIQVGYYDGDFDLEGTQNPQKNYIKELAYQSLGYGDGKYHPGDYKDFKQSSWANTIKISNVTIECYSDEFPVFIKQIETGDALTNWTFNNLVIQLLSNSNVINGSTLAQAKLRSWYPYEDGNADNYSRWAYDGAVYLYKIRDFSFSGCYLWDIEQCFGNKFFPNGLKNAIQTYYSLRITANGNDEYFNAIDDYYLNEQSRQYTDDFAFSKNTLLNYLTGDANITSIGINVFNGNKDNDYEMHAFVENNNPLWGKFGADNQFNGMPTVECDGNSNRTNLQPAKNNELGSFYKDGMLRKTAGYWTTHAIPCVQGDIVRVYYYGDHAWDNCYLNITEIKSRLTTKLASKDIPYGYVLQKDDIIPADYSYDDKSKDANYISWTYEKPNERKFAQRYPGVICEYDETGMIGYYISTTLDYLKEEPYVVRNRNTKYIRMSFPTNNLYATKDKDNNITITKSATRYPIDFFTKDKSLMITINKEIIPASQNGYTYRYDNVNKKYIIKRVNSSLEMPCEEAQFKSIWNSQLTDTGCQNSGNSISLPEKIINSYKFESAVIECENTEDFIKQYKIITGIELYNNDKIVRDIITPQMFGAVGDGITNDIDAIQKMFDSIPSIGGRIYFPEGEYLIKPKSDTYEHIEGTPEGRVTEIRIQNKNNVYINFHKNTIIKGITSNSAINNKDFLDVCNIFTFQDCNNIQINKGTFIGDKDLRIEQLDDSDYNNGKIDSNRVQGACVGLKFLSCNNIRLYDINISNIWGDAIAAAPYGFIGNSCNDVIIKGCIIDNCLRNGITIGGAIDCSIKNCKITNIRGTMPEAGIDLEAEWTNVEGLSPENRYYHNDNITIDNCHIESCGSQSIVKSKDTKKVSIENCYLANRMNIVMSNDRLINSEWVKINNTIMENGAQLEGNVELNNSSITGWILIYGSTTKLQSTSQFKAHNCSFYRTKNYNNGFSIHRDYCDLIFDNCKFYKESETTGWFVIPANDYEAEQYPSLSILNSTFYLSKGKKVSTNASENAAENIIFNNKWENLIIDKCHFIADKDVDYSLGNLWVKNDKTIKFTNNIIDFSKTESYPLTSLCRFSGDNNSNIIIHSNNILGPKSLNNNNKPLAAFNLLSIVKGKIFIVNNMLFDIDVLDTGNNNGSKIYTNGNSIFN